MSIEISNQTTIEDQNPELQDQSFPTAPDAQGYFFKDATMQQLGIQHQADPEDPEETLGIKVSLTKGRTLIMRELTRAENAKAQQIAGLTGKNPPKGMEANDRMSAAMVAVAGTFYDRSGEPLKLVMEDILLFKSKDWNRISIATNALNF